MCYRKDFTLKKNKNVITKLNVNKFRINDELTRLETFYFDITTINITTHNDRTIVLDQIPGN